MTNSLPSVRNEVEVQVLNHTFKFRRLRWTDMSRVNHWIAQHKMHEKLAIPSFALQEVSGRSLTPEESFKLLIALPRPALDLLYKFYRGSMDPRRMFSAPPLYSAPDAITYSSKLLEEEEHMDEHIDEIEDFLTQKFGRKEVAEEMELGRKIVQGTGLAGAITKEEEYLSSIRNQLDGDESWR